MKYIKIYFVIIYLSVGYIAAQTKTPTKVKAPTPPMGWMSWYPFTDKIDEKSIMEIADSMVSTGLKDAGYTIVQLDDGWMAGNRDASGRQYADTSKFPHGIKYLADYIHSKGLKIGIYSSNGKQTCAGYPGSYDHETIDANTYAQWGIDHLKYDACGDKEGHSDKALHTRMSKALKASGRSILFELCIFASDTTHLWGSQIADMWRTGGDIVTYIEKNPIVTYKNWYNNLNQMIGKEKYAGNGHWNNPDNLIVGYARNNQQTFEEQKAQFSLWCIAAAPLMLGNDVRKMSAETKMILLNKEAIAVNQDNAGLQGIRIQSDTTVDIWIKPLSDGSNALVIFNKKDNAQSYNLDFNLIGIKGQTKIRDLWEHKDKGVFKENYSVSIAPHGVCMLKLKKMK